MSEMTMVERIAQAIDDNCYEEGERWRACLPIMARAVLQALREPTPKMAAAFNKAISDEGWLAYEGPEFEAFWPKIIDSALSETE